MWWDFQILGIFQSLNQYLSVHSFILIPPFNHLSIHQTFIESLSWKEVRSAAKQTAVFRGSVLGIIRLRLAKIWITLSLLCSRKNSISSNTFWIKLTLPAMPSWFFPAFLHLNQSFITSSDSPSSWSLCREGPNVKFSPHSFLNASYIGHLALASTVLPWCIRNLINMSGLPK